jgi:hypothetical protein
MVENVWSYQPRCVVTSARNGQLLRVNFQLSAYPLRKYEPTLFFGVSPIAIFAALSIRLIAFIAIPFAATTPAALAIFATIRRASLLVSRLASDRRPVIPETS